MASSFSEHQELELGYCTLRVFYKASICIRFNDQHKIICEGLYMNVIWPDLIEYFVGYEVPQGRATARSLRAALLLILCGPTLWGQ
ncbi:hypothetical protein AVEN_136251-1 [Araneus ventricosus]|uniref:Uncharacterized protein n=1 Tax=Araneus ventricosus TaxID=182803 RepID=A0A4Y2KJJ9_ARAVE|nr:hypothetical protein AVEN_136251-1 [Araneus ventricosus]